MGHPDLGEQQRGAAVDDVLGEQPEPVRDAVPVLMIERSMDVLFDERRCPGHVSGGNAVLDREGKATPPHEPRAGTRMKGDNLLTWEPFLQLVTQQAVEQGM